MSKRVLRRAWIEDLATDLARVYGFLEPPVRPESLARAEGIRLIGDDFGQAFDGRLEVLGGRFVLYYNNRYGEGAGRTRFSMAHELGHFYIDDHRQFLLSHGRPHSSHAGFVDDNRAEREADLFAASLLLPRYLVLQRINRDVPDLSEAIELAGSFEASLTATAIRYVELSHFPCAVVVSRGSGVEFAFSSEAFSDRGLAYIRKGTGVPPDSPTAALAGDGEGVRMGRQCDGRIRAYWWFHDRDSDADLYEQAIGLGGSRRILTFLSADDDA